MIFHKDISNEELKKHLVSGEITFGGYFGGKIYGTLDCWSGKKMKRESRVFFRDEAEALELGFRPCGHCLKDKYQKWKDETV